MTDQELLLANMRNKPEYSEEVTVEYLANDLNMSAREVMRLLYQAFVNVKGFTYVVKLDKDGSTYASIRMALGDDEVEEPVNELQVSNSE
jgi:hypothetical protein